jgi:hypothetical protein
MSAFPVSIALPPPSLSRALSRPFVLSLSCPLLARPGVPAPSPAIPRHLPLSLSPSLPLGPWLARPPAPLSSIPPARIAAAALNLLVPVVSPWRRVRARSAREVEREAPVARRIAILRHGAPEYTGICSYLERNGVPERSGGQTQHPSSIYMRRAPPMRMEGPHATRTLFHQLGCTPALPTLRRSRKSYATGTAGYDRPTGVWNRCALDVQVPGSQLPNSRAGALSGQAAA